MEILQDLFLPCLWAFLASVAFGLVYNIHGLGILICGLGGALGWLVYLLVQLLPAGNILAAFVAAAAIAVFSECMARLRRCPVTGYLQVALLPLVPGSGIYYAMRHCVAGETSLFLSTPFSTLSAWPLLWRWEPCSPRRCCASCCPIFPRGIETNNREIIWRNPLL